MNRFGFMILAAHLMTAALLAQGQSPNADPRTIATAPPGNPVRVTMIPPRQETASDDFEDWAVEFTGGYWPILAKGTVRTASTPADLRGDLGVRGYKSHAFARLIFKPARRHELVIEGIPYRLNGANHLERQLEFAGRTFLAREEIETRIKLNSFNVDYRYDVISRKNGFAGVVTGIGYLQASSTITAVTRNIEEVSNARMAFPLIGMAFRTYPANSYPFSIDGEVKGMHFGNHGYYTQSTLGLGFSLNQIATLHLGYALLYADVHNKRETEGVKANFHGPTLAIQFRNR